MLQHDAEATRIYHRLACFSTGPKSKCVGVFCTLWARLFLLVALGRTPSARRIQRPGPGPFFLCAFSALGQALSSPARSALWQTPWARPICPLCACCALGQAPLLRAFSALISYLGQRVLQGRYALYRASYTLGTRVFSPQVPARSFTVAAGPIHLRQEDYCPSR